MASFVFSQAKLDILSGAINLNTHDFYAVLVGGTTGYTPSSTITQRVALVPTTGTNADPQLLSNRTLTLTGATVELKFTNPIWSALSATNNPITGIVICRRVGASFSTTDPVVMFLEFSAEYTSTGSSFQIVATNNVYLSVA